MYVCGMTIYDLCHIGHARMMMAFDVVQRWLKASGMRVTYVRNITDIDDKIIKRALRRRSPSASSPTMIAGCTRTLARWASSRPGRAARHGIRAADAFADWPALSRQGPGLPRQQWRCELPVRKFEGYGKLSGKSLDELRAGRARGVQDGKEDPLDFVQWKSAKADEPDDAKWASEFGTGRPGWHIECSAMSCATLGETFRHPRRRCGPCFSPPRKRNRPERRRGQAAGQVLGAQRFVRVDNEKMSKSLGNFFTIRDVLQQYDAETVRFSSCAPITAAHSITAMPTWTTRARPSNACTPR